MARLRDEILDVALERGGPYEFAGGDIANNKLNTDRLHSNRELQSRIVERLGYLALSFKADALIPVPDGGNKWAELIADLIKKPVCYLRKVEATPGLRTYDFATDWFEKVAEKKEKIMIVDDVGNRLTSIKGVMEIPIIAKRAVLVGGIWMRGEQGVTQQVDIRQKWLVEEYIPPMLPENSELWKHAS